MTDVPMADHELIVLRTEVFGELMSWGMRLGQVLSVELARTIGQLERLERGETLSPDERAAWMARLHQMLPHCFDTWAAFAGAQAVHCDDQAFVVPPPTQGVQ